MANKTLIRLIAERGLSEGLSFWSKREYLGNKEIDLSHASFKNEIVYDAQLAGADLTSATFDNVTFVGGSFNQIEANGSKWSRIVILGTEIEHAALNSSTWQDGVLSTPHVKHVTARHASWKRVAIVGVKWDYGDFMHGRWIDCSIVRSELDNLDFRHGHFTGAGITKSSRLFDIDLRRATFDPRLLGSWFKRVLTTKRMLLTGAPVDDDRFVYSRAVGRTTSAPMKRRPRNLR